MQCKFGILEVSLTMAPKHASSFKHAGKLAFLSSSLQKFFLGPTLSPPKHVDPVYVEHGAQS